MVVRLLTWLDRIAIVATTIVTITATAIVATTIAITAIISVNISAQVPAPASLAACL
jgi:hypothetical protein